MSKFKYSILGAGLLLGLSAVSAVYAHDQNYYVLFTNKSLARLHVIMTFFSLGVWQPYSSYQSCYLSPGQTKIFYTYRDSGWFDLYWANITTVNQDGVPTGGYGESDHWHWNQSHKEMISSFGGYVFSGDEYPSGVKTTQDHEVKKINNSRKK